MFARRLIFAALSLALAAPIGSAAAQSIRDWRSAAAKMVDEEVAAAGVTNERVLRAVRETPRHEFVPPNQRRAAYYDMALPIGEQQTISPPFIVAYMTQEIDPQPTDRVLEIGTGSGYQAAILSPLVKDVYTIEIVEPLGKRAARTLKKLRYNNVHTKIGDGYLGWPDAAPFDKIIVTCSPEKVPQPLVDQLREGGLMIVPVGERYQQTLYLFRKQDGELKSEALKATLFVPMTGQAESQREVLPDPMNPKIENGSFEEVESRESRDKSQQQSAGSRPSTLDSRPAEPRGWHYLRQMTIKNDAAAQDGQRYVVFQNDEPGRPSQALQGFAINGRKIDKLDLSFSVRGRNIGPGQKQTDWPFVTITFYDDRRATIDEVEFGPFTGTFDWRHVRYTISVPLKAREAIIRIGLNGAVGELAFDNIALSATP